MPTPKKKTSRMRRGHRRSHDGLTAATVVNCKNCNAITLPHRVCPSCGYYDGREVIAGAQS